MTARETERKKNRWIEEMQLDAVAEKDSTPTYTEDGIRRKQGERARPSGNASSSLPFGEREDLYLGTQDVGSNISAVYCWNGQKNFVNGTKNGVRTLPSSTDRMVACGQYALSPGL